MYKGDVSGIWANKGSCFPIWMSHHGLGEHILMPGLQQGGPAPSDSRSQPIPFRLEGLSYSNCSLALSACCVLSDYIKQ